MKKFESICNLVFRAVGLAMGVAVVVLSILGQLGTGTAITLLGIGLFSVSLSTFLKQGE